MQLDEVQSDLKDPRRFGDALSILQTQDFQKKDIKRVFNAYSDNIYYLVSGWKRGTDRLSLSVRPAAGTESARSPHKVQFYFLPPANNS